MEAVWRIEVEDFPAFIVVDDKGNDFFDLVSTRSTSPERDRCRCCYLTLAALRDVS